jgi:TRAP-type C4-dicarboxylate transport system permease small subunit
MSEPGALVRMDNAIVKSGMVLSNASSFVTLALAFIMLIDIIARFVFNSPIPGVTDTGALLLGYIVFLPLSYTLATKRHIRVESLTDRLPPRGKWIFEIFTYLIGLVSLAVLTYFSWEYFWQSLIINERMGNARVPIPWWVSKFAMFVGFAFFTLQFLSRLLLNLTRRSQEQE